MMTELKMTEGSESDEKQKGQIEDWRQGRADLGANRG
jgi:hypothetical protein